MLSLFLALIVGIYFEHAEVQVLGERKKEWKGLLKAFSYLDEDSQFYILNPTNAHVPFVDHGHINLQQFTVFMRALRPYLGGYEAAATYD